jgi:hypothetical protein
MDAEGGTGEVSRRACISGTDGSACCLPDVLAGNVVLKGLRLINRAYREDIVISSASPIHSEGMGGVIDYLHQGKIDSKLFFFTFLLSASCLIQSSSVSGI